MRTSALRRFLSVVVAVPPLAVAAYAGDADLRVTRLALFNSGVGYFECNATVGDNAVAELKFRTEQINDIIKSLVVQDFSGGSIGAVGYASRDPIDKTLKSFAVDITGKPTLAQLLDQLRGEAVEISGPKAARGVIVGVERRKRTIDKDQTIEVDVLNILTDAGLVQIDVTELGGVKFLNEKISNELKKALATLASSHDADKKSVTIEFNGSGKRNVRASYLLETPIWKTSYRLVLPNTDNANKDASKDKKPFLQGWATVENATEEDWKDVKLSLVSGRPISFRMDLYTPLYVPRPVEQLELYASLRPPQFAAGFEKAPPPPPAAAVTAMRAEMKDEARAYAKKAPGARGAGRGGADRDGLADLAEAENGAVAFNSLALDASGVSSVANAQEAGELFEYVISEPVSIGRQRSAMLPIVNEGVTAEKVSIYNPATHAKYPLNGLILTNSTKLNLMQGPITIFDSDVYAGDAKLPDLKPGDKRMVGYALDLGTEVMTEAKSHPDQIVSLKIVKGVLWHKHKYVDERTYTIKNTNSKDRTVIIEQPYSGDWKLVEPKEPFERAQNLLRFKVAVAAEKSVAQPVKLEWVRDETVAITSLDIDGINAYLRTGVATEKVKQAMQQVIALRTELDNASRKRADTERNVNEFVAEQGRIRENLKTLDKGSDSYRKQLSKFDDLENKIEAGRKDLADQRVNEEQKRVALESYIASIEVE